MSSQTPSTKNNNTRVLNSEFSSDHYARHWEQYFAQAGIAEEIPEWHANYSALEPIIKPYIDSVLKKSSKDISDIRILDVGCGSSALVDGLLQQGARHVDLLDIVPSQVRKAQEKLGSTWSDLNFVVGDCRAMKYQPSTFTIVFDKGTLDALNCDVDRLAMLEECVRVSQPSATLVVSVSFAGQERIKFLQKWSKERKGGPVYIHTHFLGDGDPIRGHEVRLVTLISQTPFAVEHEVVASELTRTLQRRVSTTGSVYREKEDDEASNILPDLF